MRLRAFVLLLTATALLAGCGGSDGGDDNGVAAKSADEIVADATAAAKAAESVYVHGGTADGAGDPVQLDLHLVAGEGGEGHLVVNGLSFDIVRIDDKAYFKGDADFWKQFGGDAAAQLFDDKWVVAPATSGDLASLTPLTDLVSLLGGILESHGTLEKGDETEVNGNAAITVEDSERDGTIYVATENEPYPLKLEGGGDAAGEILFEDWDDAYELEAPEDPVDISQLPG